MNYYQPPYQPQLFPQIQPIQPPIPLEEGSRVGLSYLVLAIVVAFCCGCLLVVSSLVVYLSSKSKLGSPGSDVLTCALNSRDKTTLDTCVDSVKEKNW